MKEQLISFDTAKLAKEKGFKEKTLYYYYYYEDNKDNRRLYKDKIGTSELVANSVSKMSRKTATEAGFCGCNTSDYLYSNTKLEDIYINIDKYPAKKVMFQAPTQSLLQKWLREEHKIFVAIESWFGRDIEYRYNIEEICVIGYNKMNRFNGNSGVYKSYEEALEAGLLEALKLIK